MARTPIRRSQLIAPFGPGALIVSRDGTSMICAGLDHWYKRDDLSYDGVDLKEYELREWRLESMLGVTHFKTPPDYRYESVGYMNEEQINKYLTVPSLRFPQWHYCRNCGFMEPYSLTVRGRLECPECKKRGKRGFMVQVPIIAVCPSGHIQDFLGESGFMVQLITIVKLP